MSIPPVFTTLPSPRSDDSDIIEKIEIIEKIQKHFDAVILSPMRASTILTYFHSCHAIAGGLYLGNYRSFIESTDLALQHKTNPDCEQHTNRHGFRTVITVCPMSAFTHEYPNLNAEIVGESFRDQQVLWLQVGRTIFDDPALWPSLVHDCTFPDSEKARQEIVDTATTMETLMILNEVKREQIRSIPVQEWFHPTFTEMDRAIFGDQRVLVHCHGGISRSATVVAAYFISRFHRTTDETLEFLKKQRPCVDPRFIDALRSYERALASPPPQLTLEL